MMLHLISKNKSKLGYPQPSKRKLFKAIKE